MVEATLIDAGNPAIFVHADSLGFLGTELQSDINHNRKLLDMAEAVRASGAIKMGLGTSPEEATSKRPHTPKLAFVAPPADFTASDGRPVTAQSIDLLARMFSMGQLHHAIPGTGAVALAAAAAIPGTLVHRIAPTGAGGQLRFGHPSGTLAVAAETFNQNGQWLVSKITLSRSARRLMEGWVRIPPTPPIG